MKSAVNMWMLAGLAFLLVALFVILSSRVWAELSKAREHDREYRLFLAYCNAGMASAFLWVICWFIAGWLEAARLLALRS